MEPNEKYFETGFEFAGSLKFCPKCRRTWGVENFGKSRQTPSGFYGHCKPCCAVGKARQYLANFEENRAIRRQYYSDNREAGIRRAAEWQAANPEKCRGYRQKDTAKAKARVRKARHKRKPEVAFKEALRSRVYMGLSKVGVRKTERTVELIGCSYEVLKQHIASQFRPGMSWENRGIVWEIDHRVPVSSFDLSDPEQRRKAFHWSNQQPLLKRENRRKGARLDWSPAVSP